MACSRLCRAKIKNKGHRIFFQCTYFPSRFIMINTFRQWLSSYSFDNLDVKYLESMTKVSTNGFAFNVYSLCKSILFERPRNIRGSLESAKCVVGLFVHLNLLRNILPEKIAIVKTGRTLFYSRRNKWLTGVGRR